MSAITRASRPNAQGMYVGELVAEYRYYRRMGLSAVRAIAAARQGMPF